MLGRWHPRPPEQVPLPDLSGTGRRRALHVGYPHKGIEGQLSRVGEMSPGELQGLRPQAFAQVADGNIVRILEAYAVPLPPRRHCPHPSVVGSRRAVDRSGAARRPREVDVGLSHRGLLLGDERADRRRATAGAHATTRRPVGFRRRRPRLRWPLPARRAAPPTRVRPGHKPAGSPLPERDGRRAAVTEIERARAFVERSYGEFDELVAALSENAP
jgi:hypothetical protein